MSGNRRRRVAIIGGGLSGLSAALRLITQRPDVDVWLFESSPRLGGVIQTTRDQDFLFEHSADSFIVSPELPWAGELCDQIGVELQGTSAQYQGAQIVKDGELYPVPAGLRLMSIHRMSSVLKSPLLSWRGKLRVLAERFIPPGKLEAEESLKQFSIRRYGNEMFERVIQPLVSGIYTADPERLSMTAALAQFVKQEQKYGSLYGAARAMGGQAQTRGARYALFRSPKLGMQALIDQIENQLTDVTIYKNTPVTDIENLEGGYELSLKNRQSRAEDIPTFDGIIIATPVRYLSGLTELCAPAIAQAAAKIECVSTAVIGLGLHRKQFARPLESFGAVVPHVEGRRILAVSFTSVKFPERRAPSDHELLRVFVGGALQQATLEHNDQELVDLAMEELGPLLGLSGSPIAQHVFRWMSTTPQYNLGHRDRVAKIRDAEASLDAFAIAGNAYSGVGIPQCILSGQEAAEKVLRELPS